MFKKIAKWKFAIAAILLSCSSFAEELTEYTLDSGDTVRVVVFGHADLSGEYEVDGAGRLSLPLIENISASGLSLAELEVAIRDGLMPDYLVNPRVSVEIVGYRPFYILGEVNTPGSYPYVNGMTVVSAIALAGGYTYRAKRNDMLIRRGVGDAETVITAGPETMVQPGDVVEIAERFF